GNDLFQPTWVERSGEARPVGPEGWFRQPRFMADDKTVLIEKADGESGWGDLWMLDARVAQKSRSTEFKGGRGRLRLSTATWCRRASISRAVSRRVRKKTRTATRSARTNSVMNSRL